MATITTNHDTYTGRTVGSIVRREYGRAAEVRWSSDPNSPEAGLIVEKSRYGGWSVLGTLRRYDGPVGTTPEDT